MLTDELVREAGYADARYQARYQARYRKNDGIGPVLYFVVMTLPADMFGVTNLTAKGSTTRRAEHNGKGPEDQSSRYDRLQKALMSEDDVTWNSNRSDEVLLGVIYIYIFIINRKSIQSHERGANALGGPCSNQRVSCCHLSSAIRTPKSKARKYNTRLITP